MIEPTRLLFIYFFKKSLDQIRGRRSPSPPHACPLTYMSCLALPCSRNNSHSTPRACNTRFRKPTHSPCTDARDLKIGRVTGYHPSIIPGSIPHRIDEKLRVAVTLEAYSLTDSPSHGRRRRMCKSVRAAMVIIILCVIHFALLMRRSNHVTGTPVSVGGFVIEMH